VDLELEVINITPERCPWQPVFTLETFLACQFSLLVHSSLPLWLFFFLLLLTLRAPNISCHISPKLPPSSLSPSSLSPHPFCHWMSWTGDWNMIAQNLRLCFSTSYLNHWLSLSVLISLKTTLDRVRYSYPFISLFIHVVSFEQFLGIMPRSICRPKNILALFSSKCFKFKFGRQTTDKDDNK
jgi:hypothetical protein